MTDVRPINFLPMRQEIIRQWARERNMLVGRRGSLPRSIVEAYHKEISQLQDESPVTERQEQPVESAIQSLDPLADYLEPQFGDVYELFSKHGDRWTPKLKDAVTQYLLHEVTDADFEAISLEHLSYVPTGNTRAARVQSIIERESIFGIALSLHFLAVENAPSLDSLLEQDASLVDLQLDCASWLYENGTYDRLVEVARISGLLRRLKVPEVLPPSADEDDARFWLTDELLDHLSFKALVDAWSYVTTTADTDLANEEWSILEPLLPTQSRAKFVSSSIRRQVINGLLYLDAHPERQLLLPVVYRRNYRRLGVFARILESLEEVPGAERIVTWLRRELRKPEPVRQGSDHD